jgi:hypothetical protein
MKKIILALTCILFAGLYNAYPQQQTISDDDNLYSLSIPSAWVHASSKNSVISMLMCSDTVNIHERLSIICSKSYYNLAKTFKNNEAAFKDVKNFKIIKEGDGKIGGQPAKWFMYTFESNDGASMKGTENTVLKSGRSYIIQYVALDKRFEISKETFEKMIASFKFNK